MVLWAQFASNHTSTLAVRLLTVTACRGNGASGVLVWEMLLMDHLVTAECIMQAASGRWQAASGRWQPHYNERDTVPSLSHKLVSMANTPWQKTLQQGAGPLHVQHC